MTPAAIDFGHAALRFDGAAHIMGILNVTPDSFSDGGVHLQTEAAVASGLQMLQDGATILDIGGESTRPGAQPVSPQQELDRVVPVIAALRKAAPQAIISIDTTKAAVAAACLKAGADIVNDLSGFDFDPQMASVVADAGAAAVLMHIRGTPRTMQRDTHYDDVVDDVCAALDARIKAAVDKGVQRHRLMVDPGIGFGKNMQGNVRLIKHAHRFGHGEHAVLIGPSRKSFIGHILSEPDPTKRVWGTAGAVAAAVCFGAHILRVHDVKPMVEAIRVAEAIHGAP